MTFTLMRYLSVTFLIILASRIAIAQKPELVLQTGHSDAINKVALSPDGRMLATASADKTVRLWEVATGTELRTFTGHVDAVLSVAFSTDGRMLASGCTDKTVKLWDVSSGSELHTLRHANWVTSVAFSADGKALASGSWDGTIKVWDVNSGTELHEFKGNPSSMINSVAFSPVGETLASSWNSTIKLWDLASGTELRTLEGHSYIVNSVTFSADGKTLASSDDGKQLWSGSGDAMVKLWDVSKGTELRTIKGNSNWVKSVTFSPDGMTLAGASDHTIRLWNISSGAELPPLIGHSNNVITVIFSHDGKTLISGSIDRTIRIWDLESRSEIRILGGHSDKVNSVAFSTDGKTLATGSWDYVVKLWDLASGAEVHTLSGHSGSVSWVGFSIDGRILASGSWDGTVKLWDVASGAELRTLRGHASEVASLAFSPDGKTLASSSGRTILVWDLNTGALLTTLQGHSDLIFSLAYSSDGTLASGSADRTVKLWEARDGIELRTLDGHSSMINSIAFSPDGMTLAGSGGKTVKLWDVKSGRELPPLTGHSSMITSIAFSPDGKTLASGDFGVTTTGVIASDGGTIKLWDVPSRVPLRTLTGHSSEVTSVAFSADGKTLASSCWHSSTKLWRVANGEELLSLVSVDEREWAVVSPNGLFDGSRKAWNQLIWRLDNNTFNWVPVEAFFNNFYYPGLLNEILAGKQPKPPKKDLSAVDIRQPQVRITSVGRQAVSESAPSQLAFPHTLIDRNVEVSLEITDNIKTPSRSADPKTSGARDVRLFRNGSLVKLWPGDTFVNESGCEQPSAQKPLATRRTVCTVTVPIVAGENRLTAYAFNHDNIKSRDATLTITGADKLARKGVAYILAIGVNDYANNLYNLKYAVADAQDFAEEFKRQQAKLNNYDRVETISLSDKDATKARILKSLTDLGSKMQPEDALMIFFAGHGTAQQNRFYFVPHDLGYMGSRTQLDSAGLGKILAHGISDQELERTVEGIDAGQMLLVIDACNSGQALEAEEKRRGPMNSKGLAQLAYEKGMYILTAAQSYQAANEAERYGHGFLTYALVEEGLKTSAADREPKDGQVLLREWLDFATERVPQMQQDELDKQKKQGRRLNRIKFAEADSGNERSLQRPRVFYRRETEAYPLIVAKP